MASSAEVKLAFRRYASASAGRAPAAAPYRREATTTNSNAATADGARVIKPRFAAVVPGITKARYVPGSIVNRRLPSLSIVRLSGSVTLSPKRPHPSGYGIPGKLRRIEL